jgi:secretion/DNA translocation related TadE-like protein
MMWRGDSGSGSLLAVALAGSIAAVALVALPLYKGLSIRESVGRTADAAALAGADVAAGIAPGIPCGEAGSVVAANGDYLGGCSVDGQVVSVTAWSTFLGMRLTASATAGPPGAVTN